MFLKDDILSEAARKHGLPDLDIYGKGGPLLTLLEAVVSQQLADRAARAIFARLEAFISESCPGIISLAYRSKEELRELGVSGNKAETIIRVCAAARDGSLDLGALSRKSDAEVVEELVRIRGIGPWTAQMYLIFGMKRKDVWPSTDFGIRKNLSLLLGRKKLMEPEKVEAFGSRWAPYRSYAAIYIWKG